MKYNNEIKLKKNKVGEVREGNGRAVAVVGRVLKKCHEDLPICVVMF